MWGGRRLTRWGWLALGLFCVALGIVGVLVPLMPTTIFLILATACFARSSPTLEKWLLDHPRFGPSLRSWREQRAIPMAGKIGAATGMSAGFVLFCWLAHPGLVLAGAVGLVLFSCLCWIVTRPAPVAAD